MTRKIEYKSMYLLYISLIYYIVYYIVMSRMSGKLVSLSVDTLKNNDVDVAVSGTVHNEEQTMLWANVATLFAKCDQYEDELQKHQESYERLTRGTDDLYQELQDTKNEIQHETNDERNKLSTHVRKLRKYVNKKCEQIRGDISYSSYSDNSDVMMYINALRSDYEARTSKLEDEVAGLHAKLEETNHVYDSDYQMFVNRENDLMAKLEESVQTTASLNQRVKDLEYSLMAQIQESREYAEQQHYTATGDLREEFARAICREVEYESKVNAKLVQSVNDELFELITRSNEYHSARYFGTVEDVKAVREMCATMKQSIGMVDAELSDVKETVEFLKDEVAQSSNDVYDIKEEFTEWKDEIYREMDHDYYDIKDYVKRKFHRHDKQKHAVKALMEEDPIQMIANEYAEATEVPVAAAAAAAAAEDEGTIIILDNILSDDE